MRNIEKKKSDRVDLRKKVWTKPYLILLSFRITKESMEGGNDGSTVGVGS